VTAATNRWPTVLGIDPSLTSTGLVRIDQHDGVQLYRIRPRVKGHDRLDAILDAVSYSVRDADLVVIEGPSYGSTGTAYHQLAGLWWLITHHLYRAGRPYAVVSPQARAKYATGNGGAGKDAVLAAVVRRYADVDVTGNDVADALILAAMGARWIGEPIDSVPKTHLVAMDKVSWPEAVSA
jgi:crossover junction endodeoxyribonuclease RuvC